MKKIKEGKRGTFWVSSLASKTMEAHQALKELCFSGLTCKHCKAKVQRLLHALDITCGSVETCQECYEEIETEAKDGK